MIIIVNTITAVLLAAVGFLGGLLCCPILNRIPAEWLCDYDEAPDEALLSGKRYSVKRNGVVFGIALGLSTAAIYLINGTSQSQLISLFLCFVLTLIAAADAKYQIIPDQFTIAVMFIAIDFAIIDCSSTQMFISKWYQPLIGAAVGGGILMALDIFSMLVLKKEGFGFGDIKLMAALGIMFGAKYIIVLLVAASLIAAVHFLILIFKGNGRIEEGKYLPMAPYLCMGAAVTVMFLPWLNKMFELYAAVFEMKTLP